MGVICVSRGWPMGSCCLLKYIMLNQQTVCVYVCVCERHCCCCNIQQNSRSVLKLKIIYIYTFFAQDGCHMKQAM